MTIKVYVASKSYHGPTWCMWRSAWKRELPQVKVVSTWIDESGPGQSSNMSDLWHRCVAEAASADLLLALYIDGEEWKGAYVEIGAALAAGAEVIVVAPDGSPPGSWVEHERVTVVSYVGVDIGSVLVDWLAARSRSLGGPA